MFPKFHGIEIAQGGSIKNAAVERLANDPALTRAGRIWFNTTSNKYKGSIEDPDNNGQFIAIEIVNSLGLAAANAAINDSISTETNRALTAENVLASNIDNEANTREAADQVLVAAVETEVLARTTAIAALSSQFATGLAGEVTARDAAIAASVAAVSDQLVNETTTLQFDDQMLGQRIDGVQSELNTTQAGVGLDVNGDYIAVPGSNFIAAATSIAEATTLLDTALKAEETSRIASDSANAAAIAAEAQARAAGDAALQTQLEEFVNAAIGSNEIADQVEAAARIAADTALQTELNATQAGAGLGIDGALVPFTGTAYIDEATTLANASVLLDIQLERVDSALTSEIANRVAAGDALTAAIQAETTARGTAIGSVQTELDATQSGAGLGSDGSYTAPTGSNYLGATTSLKGASLALDTALKTLADSVGVLASSESSEATRALAAEAVLQGNINAVSAAVADFKTLVNNSRRTYSSAAPALVHSFQHNLNSEFISVSIMVKGDDDIWRNDYVPYEAGVDALNNMVFTLLEERHIRVAVQSLDQLE